VAEHVGHDPLLVAAAADRGGRLADVLAACAECLTLLSDLRVLAVATPAAAIPRRPRDLRLTIDDARRLRQRGWRRILAGLGAGRDAVTRPLAMSLTTLGLVGLLLGSVPPGLPFADAAGSGSASGDTTQPLRTTGAPGGDEAAGSPGGLREDTSSPRVAAAPLADDGLLRVLSLGVLALGAATFAVGRWTSARGSVR
jgi:hypothetical protein